MKYIIVDLEATCWEDASSRDRMEIIEIGAVKLASACGPIESEFARFVKPAASPVLSEFCKKLTSIRQEDVDDAASFSDVFPDFLAWMGNDEFRLCSWGGYDLNQFEKDCSRHKLVFPETFKSHINLKKQFAIIKGVKPMGMTAALRSLKIRPVGIHHRGIDDARNIGKIAQAILPQLEAKK